MLKKALREFAISKIIKPDGNAKLFDFFFPNIDRKTMMALGTMLISDDSTKWDALVKDVKSQVQKIIKSGKLDEKIEQVDDGGHE